MPDKKQNNVDMVSDECEQTIAFLERWCYASVLHVDSFNFKAGVKAAAKDFDFSRHQGETVRVFVDADGTYSMEHGTHEWLLFMAEIPECTYRQVYDGTDENGMEKNPLSLSLSSELVVPLMMADENLNYQLFPEKQ